jgi:peptidoglycan hydrolase-like protein with peptidoglycan-binding domain
MRPLRRGRVAAAGVVVVAAAVGVAVWRTVGAPSTVDPLDTPAVSTTSVAVTRGDVTQRVQVSGVLGYDGSWSAVDQLPPGILTAAADPGTAVVRGADLFAVSGTPAVLLYGGSPAYRDFEAGMGDGADVRELEENLVTLGMDPGHAVTVDNHFTSATRAAIVRWQAARGLPAAGRTGVLHLGEVLFLPGALRIGQQLSTVGGSVGPGTPVLSGTSTSRVVTVQLTADRQSLVHPGDQVLVTLPGTAPVTGSVARIGRVAAVAATGGPGGGGSGSGGGTGPATVPVTVTLQVPPGAGDLDQAPVQVAITVAQHKAVLTVPVTALLARPGGGYQLRVLDGDGRRLVDVRPGLYDEVAGAVEVTGDGLAPGQTVEVPAS